MNFKFPASVALAAALTVSFTPLFAHHGTGVAYDTEKTVTAKGVVTEWIWANPHCGLLFDATDDKGNVVHWNIEAEPPNILIHAGWTKETLKPGDQVTIVGLPAKNGAPVAILRQLVLADGRELTMTEK